MCRGACACVRCCGAFLRLWRGGGGGGGAGGGGGGGDARAGLQMKKSIGDGEDALGALGARGGTAIGSVRDMAASQVSLTRTLPGHVARTERLRVRLGGLRCWVIASPNCNERLSWYVIQFSGC